MDWLAILQVVGPPVAAAVAGWSGHAVVWPHFAKSRKSKAATRKRVATRRANAAAKKNGTPF